MKANLRTTCYDRYLAFRASIEPELPPRIYSDEDVSALRHRFRERSPSGYVPRERQGTHRACFARSK